MRTVLANGLNFYPRQLEKQTQVEANKEKQTIKIRSRVGDTGSRNTVER